jgi:hypothetical protein
MSSINGYRVALESPSQAQPAETYNETINEEEVMHIEEAPDSSTKQ